MNPNLNKSQQEQLELQSFLVQSARERLLNFCQIINERYEAVWFHELIAETLERAIKQVEAKGKARIILSVPPRHGKSQLSSIYFPAWALGKYPHLQFILSTYGAELAEELGMKARDVINSESFQAIFPNIQLRQDTKAKAKWMTNKGGSFTAVGIGGAITGKGGDIILVDDAHKDRQEAESETMRDRVWEYFQSTLYSRLEGSGAVIVIMQRWHVDDLVGRLKEEEEKLKLAGQPHDEWEIINFPAIADEDEIINGHKVRSIGEALWPSKFPIPVLKNIAAKDVYNWASQYMQSPILAEHQEFKQHMFKYYNEEELKGKYLRYYTFVDPAISQKKEADNTVVLTVAKEINGPNFYRVKEDAGHFTPDQTIQLIFQHAIDYRSDVFLETVAYQKALKYAITEEQRKRQVYFVVREVKSTGNKEMRIRGLLPLYNAGVVHHRHSDFEYEREALSFPRGKRDDRIDAMSFLLLTENTQGNSVQQFKKKFNGYFRNK